MATTTIIRKTVRITGYEWYKSSEKAPFKISAIDVETKETVTIVFWGKTHPGQIIQDEVYEVELSSAKNTEKYGIQYTLARKSEEHGPKHMVLVKNGEKIKPIEGLKLKFNAVEKTEIKVIGKWRKINDYNFTLAIRDLDTEFGENALLVFNGQNKPEFELGSNYLVEVIKRVDDDQDRRSYQFKNFIKKTRDTLSFKDIDRLNNEETDSNNKSDDALDTIFKEIFDAMQEDSLNYVPGYKTYRASSVNECARKTLLKKWEVDYSAATRKNIAALRKSVDYDRDRMGATWVGTAIHEYIENIMKKKSIYMSSEEKIRIQEKGIAFVGHYDLLLKINGQLYVGDIKTTNPKHEGTQYEFKLEKHFKQLNIYQHYFDGIPGLIIYVQRNKGKITIFKNAYSAALWNKTLNQAILLADCEMRHELPALPSSYSVDSAPCTYGPEYPCEYREICWRNAK